MIELEVWSLRRWEREKEPLVMRGEMGKENKQQEVRLEFSAFPLRSKSLWNKGNRISRLS